MKIRDRIKELRRVRAGVLRPHPKNWRTHPAAQQRRAAGRAGRDRLRRRPLGPGIARRIARTDRRPSPGRDHAGRGGAGAGGRSRRRRGGEAPGPARSAGRDGRDGRRRCWPSCWPRWRRESEAVQRLLDGMLGRAGRAAGRRARRRRRRRSTIPEAFQVVVECRDEDQQRDVFERLTAEGLKCRLLTLVIVRTVHRTARLPTCHASHRRHRHLSRLRFVPRPAGGRACSTCRWPSGRRERFRRRRARTGRRLADRPDRRARRAAARARSPGELFGERLYRAAALARGSRGGRLPGRPADQGDHRAVHGRGFQLAAELDQAVPRALAAASSSAATWPGRWPRRASGRRAAAGRVRRVHQRGRPQRGADRLGGDCQGDSRGADRVPASWRSRATTTWPSGSSRTGCSTWPRRRSRGGVFGDRAIELEIFRCRAWCVAVFARHHYLSGSLSAAARCFLALWRGRAGGVLRDGAA